MLKRFLHITTCLCVFLWCASEVTAQSKRATSTSSYRGRYKAVKVPKSRAQLLCPGAPSSEYPYHGIGIKVGDPTALTYKLYIAENFAMAVDVGKTASGLYSRYYRDNFDQALDQQEAVSTNYLGHDVRHDWSLQGKILFQRDASSLLDGLQWYAGGGWQWRKTKIQYDYLHEVNTNNSQVAYVQDSYLTFGPALSIGLEYVYADTPLAAFMEMEWYMDVVKTPGHGELMGGVGVRYLIK